ncbi:MULTISPECIES: hypothetical protein [unclassified Kribbella]
MSSWIAFFPAVEGTRNLMPANRVTATTGPELVGRIQLTDQDHIKDQTP